MTEPRIARPATATSPREVEHRYGDRVHILDDVYALSALARIGSPETAQRDVVTLLRSVYHVLFTAACGRELRTTLVDVPTRMAESHPTAGRWRGRVFDPELDVVVVDVIRAGIVPSQMCFELALGVLPERRVRLDHLTLARRSDADGRVIGVDLSGSKIGGTVEGAVLILPDPMGATGATTLRVLRHYTPAYGTPAKIVALPMIATPEYLRAVLEEFPWLCVYTARVDRGLSDADVLATPPGTHWDRERGLDAHGYIVPGAGGMGEVLNNSWC